MPEFKKKTALGLRDLPENGQECTHVLLTHSEYDGLLAKVACAERDARSVYTAASQKIAQAERNSAQAKEAAYAEVDAVQKDLEEACRKIEYLNGLNKTCCASRGSAPTQTESSAPRKRIQDMWYLPHQKKSTAINHAKRKRCGRAVGDRAAKSVFR